MEAFRVGSAKVGQAAFVLALASCAGQPGGGTPSPAPVQGGVSVLELLNTGGRSLTVGSSETGTLSDADYRDTDDSYLEAWSLVGTTGTTVTVDLQATSFDPFLYVLGPGLGDILRDDDSGDGCDARLTFTILEPAPYRVVVSTLGPGQMGSYTLSVSELPPPVPTHECGEFDPSLLASIPTGDRRLEMGSVVNGVLSPDAVTIEGNIPVEAWRLSGRAGESVTVRLESDDFDAKLYIGGPGLDAVLSDDDGGGGLNSLLTIDFPEDGDYIVVASALSQGATGSYTLRVEAPVDLNTLATGGRVATAGNLMRGTLSEEDPIAIDGRRGQAWELRGNAGESVTIELRSTDFDAYLYVVGPGLGEPLADDDSAGELNARIAMTFPESGVYRIIVSGLTATSVGDFELRVNPGM